MTTTPAEYVSMDLLISCGFNYDAPCHIFSDDKENYYRIFLSEPQEGCQLMLAAVINKKRTNWYFRKIPDISQEDGLGIQEEKFDLLLKELINPEYKIKPKNLEKILQEAIK